MEKKSQVIWFFYACILCLCFSRTTAALTRMMSLPMQAYFLLTAGVIVAALLAVYLPGKLIAGRLRLDIVSLTQRGKMSLTDWSLVLFLLGVLVCARLFFAPAGIVTDGQICFDLAASPAGAHLSGLFSGDFYVWLLHLGIGLFDRNYAVFWCNLILQAAGCLFFYIGVHRLTGTVCAVTSVLSVICLPPFFNSTFTAEPQSLLLTAAGILMLVCAGCLDWILRHPGNRYKMPAVCATGILCGAFAFFDIRLCCFILLFISGFLILRRKKKPDNLLLTEYGCAVLFGFFILVLLAVFMSGQHQNLSQSVSALMGEWYVSLAGGNRTALLHSPTMTEYWMTVPVYLLSFFALFGASEKGLSKGAMWILPLSFLVLTEFLSNVVLQEQGLRFLYFGVLSGFGILSMLHAEPEEAAEPRMQKEETPEPEEDRVPSFAVPDTAKEARPGPGEYLENPLPVPRRHVKKEMGYAFEPAPEQMYFEVPVADNDDFDV